MMILIAGTYRSGTGDDPDLLRRNLARLEEAAWPIFQAVIPTRTDMIQ
jgi:hypothetical protein